MKGLKRLLAISAAFLIVIPVISASPSRSISMSIENPRAGHLYINDKEILPLPFGMTIIFGKITVRVSCGANVNKVKFIVDGITKYVDYDPPFEWTWDESIMGLHSLRVKAFDENYNIATDEIKVLVYNYKKQEKWPLTVSNIYIDDLPTVEDFIPIGIVHMETEDHILKNLPDPQWGLQCFIFVGWGKTIDGKHYMSFQGRAPIVGSMVNRIYLDGKWYYLPPTTAPMYLDDEGRYFKYPTVYTKGETLTSISYDEKKRTWIFRMYVPSKNIDIKIIGRAQGIPFWMGKAEGAYIIHGVDCGKKDIDIWGGFWDVGHCTIYVNTSSFNSTFYGNFLFDRAYHRCYYERSPSGRRGLAYFSCMYLHGEQNEKFDLMFSHSLNPSPLENPVPMEHQARINFLDRNESYAFTNFTFSDDRNLQPSTFHFDGTFSEGEIHLEGKAISYWPPAWPIYEGLWWNPDGEHSWGRAFVVWNGTITLHGETIEVRNVSSIGEFTRYRED